MYRVAAKVEEVAVKAEAVKLVLVQPVPQVGQQVPQDLVWRGLRGGYGG
jgi:hypothetical protein